MGAVLAAVSPAVVVPRMVRLIEEGYGTKKGIPLSLGLGCGDLVLTVAVLAIVITAPLGAFAINLSYKKLLEK